MNCEFKTENLSTKRKQTLLKVAKLGSSKEQKSGNNKFKN